MQYRRPSISARCARAVAAGAAVAALSISALAQSAAQAPSDAFTVLNSRFRAEYARARAETLARSGPVILVHEGDKAVLVRNGTRSEVKFAPESDLILRTVAHVPFALHVALTAAGSEPLTPQRHTELSRYQQLISNAQTSLAGRGFAQPVLDRQQRILAESARFLDHVLEKRQVDPRKLTAFARAMAPLMLANVDEAARAQIDGLHAAVSRWRQSMSQAEWDSLRVVVMGVHMARDGELASQYFLRLLGEEAEGRRVVYAESIFDEKAALDLLGTHIVDGSSGAAFFGSEQRMHRDVLADATRLYLDILGIGIPEPSAAPAQPPAASHGGR